MSRDSVAIMDLVANNGTVAATTAINATNGAVVASGGKDYNTIIVVKNTGGTIGTVSLVPGAYPPAFRQGMGTQIVNVPATTGERVIMVESAFAAQANGDIYIDFTPAGFTGTIQAYRVPAL